MRDRDAKTIESLRCLIDRLNSSEVMLGEAKLLRLQIAQTIGEASWLGIDSMEPGPVRAPSA